MSAYRRQDRDNLWWYRKRVRLPDGRSVRIQGKPAANTKAAAQAAERAHIERVLNPPTQVAERSELLLRAFVEERFVPESRGDWKYSERVTTKSLLKNHLLPRLGDLDLADIRGAAIQELRVELKRAGLQDKSAYNVLTLLRRVLRYAHRLELIESVPHFPMPKAVKQGRREAVEIGIRRENFLAFEELERLLDAAECPMLKAMILVGARAGLRAGELRALRWQDINQARGEILVVRAEYRGIIDKPKSGSGRRVPLPARVREALGKLPRPVRSSELCFTRPGAKGFSEGEMTAQLLEAGCNAELPTAQGRRDRRNQHQRAYRLRRLTRPLTAAEELWLAEHESKRSTRFGWHTLRHTFCTHLAMTGTPVVKIQRWAGHSDITTTQRYMHWAPSEDDAKHIDALDNPSAQVIQLVRPLSG